MNNNSSSGIICRFVNYLFGDQYMERLLNGDDIVNQTDLLIRNEEIQQEIEERQAILNSINIKIKSLDQKYQNEKIELEKAQEEFLEKQRQGFKVFTFKVRVPSYVCEEKRIVIFRDKISSIFKTASPTSSIVYTEVSTTNWKSPSMNNHVITVSVLCPESLKQEIVKALNPENLDEDWFSEVT